LGISSREIAAGKICRQWEMKMTTKKKLEKLSPGKPTRKGNQMRLEGLVASLRKNRTGLKDKIRRKSDELAIKDGELMKRTRKQLRSQLLISNKALESSDDGIFIIDAQKSGFPVIFANQSFLKMTGYGKMDILGKSYLSVYEDAVHPRNMEEITRILRRGKSFHGEMLNFQKNGKTYLNLLRIAPVLEADGLVTHYIGIQTDVTLIRKRELKIIEQREELLHVTRVGKLAEFVSSLAHEISQPLTAILSYAQAAQRMLKGKNPELHEILQYIINDDQRAAAVIHRLRALLKKNSPELKSVDINALAHDTIVLIDTDATVKHCQLKLELEDNLPRVLGDRIQLQQVLLNLVSNSFDAMEDNHAPREITIITSLNDANTVMVAVKDTGCGIPPNNLPKLFTHFFTSKPDGLGMGLSISRSIIETHGGRLDASNNPDRGATFYFTLPVLSRIPG